MTAGPFHTLAGVQAIDGRVQSSDSAVVAIHGGTVDQEIENWLIPYTASFPLSPAITADINQAANYETLARVLISIFHDYKAAEFWSKKYKENKSSIIERLQDSDTGAKKVPGTASNDGPHMKGGRA